MEIKFVAIFKKEDIYYNIVFPDLYGVVSFANSLDEARTMAKDALKEAYLSNMIDSSKPSSLEKIKKLFPNYICEEIKIDI